MPLESHLTVLEREVRWHGTFTTEPHEAGWAREAAVFIRNLEDPSSPRAQDEAARVTAGVQVTVEISPDGIHWTPEGTEITLPPPGEQAAATITHFGGWLRLAGTLPASAQTRFRVSLHLKA